MTMQAGRGSFCRRGARAAAVLGAIAFCAGSTPAVADEPGPDALPITVVAVQTSEAYDQAEALTKALRNSVRGTLGWSLGEGDYSLEVLTLSLKCSEPPDASCESRIADQIKADRFVWGVVHKQDADVVGTLHMWVRGKGSTNVALRYSANLTEPADDALRRVADDAVEKLTGGPPKGGVLIKASNVAGQVFIDGVAVGALTAGQGTFPLPAGPHRIVVKAVGYADAEAPAIIKPNATIEVVLNPIPVEPDEAVDFRKIGGFVGLGLGVAFVGAGVFSSLKVNSIQNNSDFENYRATLTTNEDACEVAGSADRGNSQITEFCDQAGTFEILQAVFYGVGAVAGGAGIYLLATSGSSEPQTTGLSIAPQLGKTTTGVDISYRW